MIARSGLGEIYMLFNCKKKITMLTKSSKYFSAGVISTLIGSIVGLLVDDSGVF